MGRLFIYFPFPPGKQGSLVSVPSPGYLAMEGARRYYLKVFVTSFFSSLFYSFVSSSAGYKSGGSAGSSLVGGDEELCPGHFL